MVEEESGVAVTACGSEYIIVGTVERRRVLCETRSTTRETRVLQYALSPAQFNSARGAVTAMAGRPSVVAAQNLASTAAATTTIHAVVAVVIAADCPVATIAIARTAAATGCAAVGCD